MTTLTFKSLKSGKPRIEIHKHIDQLKKRLRSLVYDPSKRSFSYTQKGETFELVGVAYDQYDESIPLLKRYRIIPSDDEYGN